jgi:hypothetical protein
MPPRAQAAKPIAAHQTVPLVFSSGMAELQIEI